MSKLVLFLLLSACTAEATVGIYKWMPNEILLAADSQWIKWDKSGQLAGYSECKTKQTGDLFVFLSGNVIDHSSQTKLYDIAMQAAETPGGIVKIMAAFDRLARPRMTPTSPVARKKLGVGNKPDRLSAVFADRRTGTLGNAEYVLAGDGRFVRESYRIHKSKQDANITFMGAHGEAYTALSESGVIHQKGIFDVPFLVRFFATQFAIDKAMVARGEIETARSSGPVSILRIANGEAAWVNGYQGACPAVR